MAFRRNWGSAASRHEAVDLLTSFHFAGRRSGSDAARLLCALVRGHIDEARVQVGGIRIARECRIGVAATISAATKEASEAPPRRRRRGFKAPVGRAAGRRACDDGTEAGEPWRSESRATPGDGTARGAPAGGRTQGTGGEARSGVGTGTPGHGSSFIGLMAGRLGHARLTRRARSDGRTGSSQQAPHHAQRAAERRPGSQAVADRDCPMRREAVQPGSQRVCPQSIDGDAGAGGKRQDQKQHDWRTRSLVRHRGFPDFGVPASDRRQGRTLPLYAATGPGGCELTRDDARRGSALRDAWRVRCRTGAGDRRALRAATGASTEDRPQQPAARRRGAKERGSGTLSGVVTNGYLL